MSNLDFRDLLTQGDTLEKDFDSRSENHQDVQDCLNDIREWLERCVDYGRFLPDPSPDRRALQGRVDYWTSLLWQRGRPLPDIDRIADFDPEAGFPLDVDFPYPGLAAYTENEHAFFYGREREANEGVIHLEENKALLLVSESGGGKSSLAMAGILPMLAQGHPDWLRAPRMTPGAQPVEALSYVLCAVLPALRPNFSVVVESEEVARDVIQPVVKALGERTLVLFIDQLEELLTLCNDGRQQAAFSTLLCALTNTSDCRIVATMRMDHQQQLADSQSCRVLFRLLAANNGVKTLAPLGFDAIRAAILKPAQAVGLRFVPPEIVDKLAQQTANLVGGLPLLQFALWRLWESRPKRDDSRLDLINAEQLKHLPSVQAALGTAAQAQYEALTPSMQGVCERLMQELTVLAENYQDPMRRRRRASEVVRLLKQHKQANPQDVQNLINDFIDAKLLVRTGKGENAQLEVAHEALFRNWETFRNWVSGDATKERLQAIRQIGRDAAQWVVKDQTADYLNLKGEPLHKALDYAQEGWLDEVSRTYVQDCKRAEQKRHRVRHILNSVCALLVGIVVALGIYLYQTQIQTKDKEVRVNKSLRFASQAKAALGLDPINSAWLALRAVYQMSQGETIPDETKEALNWASQAFETTYTLQGHVDLVTDVAFSPIDRTQLVTSSKDGSVRLWQTPFDHTGLRKYFYAAQVTASLPSVTRVAFRPDGTQLVTANGDGSVKVWDVATGRKLRTLAGHTTPITSMAFRPDGTRLVTASEDGVVKVWDTATGEPLYPLAGHTTPIISVAFRPDGTRFVTASKDGVVQVWDTATGRQLYTQAYHTAPVISVAFRPDGTRLVTASEDGIVQVWDDVTGWELHMLPGLTPPITSMAFRPKETQLVTASADGVVQVWDAATFQPLRTLPRHTALITRVTFSPDGTQLVTASKDGVVQVGDATTSEQLRTLPGHTAPITSVAFRPDRTQLVTASEDGVVQVWDATTAQQLRTLPGHDTAVTSVTFSPNGTQLVTASEDGVVYVWDATTAQPLHKLRGHTAPITSVAFRPDGTQLVTASEDRVVQVWDTATGQPLRTLPGHDTAVTSVAFRPPDGTQLVTASKDGVVQMWDAATGQQLYTQAYHTAPITLVTFSPNGTQLVTASTVGGVYVGDAATGQQLHTLPGHTARLRCVTFSPDGTKLVTASEDGVVQVWNATTAQPLRTLPGHTAPVTSVAFRLDGTQLQLVTASDDGMAKVWAVGDKTVQERFSSVTVPKAQILGVAFSPDNQTLVTVSRKGWVRRDDLLYDLYDKGSKGSKVSEKLIRKVEDIIMKLCELGDRTNLKRQVESEESDNKRLDCLTNFRQ